MTALRLQGIEKVFPNGHVAVAGVDLDVSAGEMVVLLGPSGCGKSTLLRIVAGIETPTAGSVLLDGEDVTDRPPQSRDIAMVFQNYALYPHMTVRENLGFGLRMRRVPRPLAAARVGEVAASLGLDDLLDRRPSQLSGGQRQRVALGRAIARQAKIFLLDEPLSNLDVQLRVSTRSELARLHRRLDVPMLYVTHDQEEAMTLGDRVAVMRGGKLLQVGAPLAIYARPATKFVAEFVGSPRVNVVPGVLRAQGNGAKLELLGTAVALAPSASERPSAASRRAEHRVDVAIRPEDLEIVAAGASDITGRVDVVEPLGRETVLHVVAGKDPEVAMRVLAPGYAGLHPGDGIGLRIRTDRLHLFDAETEERLPP